MRGKWVRLRKPLISIIIPVYNTEKYLRRCLNSVINQTYKELEILLINDGSTDNSAAICQEFSSKDSRIKYISKNNEGVSVTRNKGIELATGDFITFVDSDDWIEKEMYESMVNEIIINNASVVKCDYVKEKDDSDAMHELFSKKKVLVGKDESIRLYAEKKMHAGIVVQLVRKEVINRCNAFNPKYKIGEDLIYAIDIACNSSKFIILDKVFYHYCYNDRSATESSSNINDKFDNLFILYDGITEILKKNNYNNKDVLKLFSNLCFDKVYAELFVLRNNNLLYDYIKICFANEALKKATNNIIFNKLKNSIKLFYFFYKFSLVKLCYLYFKIR